MTTNREILRNGVIHLMKQYTTQKASTNLAYFAFEVRMNQRPCVLVLFYCRVRGLQLFLRDFFLLKTQFNDNILEGLSK